VLHACCRLKTEVAALKAEIAFLKGEQGEDVALSEEEHAALLGSASAWVRGPDDAPFDIGAFTVRLRAAPHVLSYGAVLHVRAVCFVATC
jgi:hypothetical protein